MAMFKNIWSLSRLVEISAMDDNLFLFKFANVKDKERVIEGGLWYFDNHLLAIHDFDGDIRLAEYKFEKALVWAKLYDLPLNLMSMDVAEKLGTKISTLIVVDTSRTRSGWSKNVHLRLEIDITKPLRRFVLISRGRGKVGI